METVQCYQYPEIPYNLHLCKLKYDCKSGESGENSSNRIFSVRLAGKSGAIGLGYTEVPNLVPSVSHLGERGSPRSPQGTVR